MDRKLLNTGLILSLLFASVFLVSLPAGAQSSGGPELDWQKTYSFGASASWVTQTGDGASAFYTSGHYYRYGPSTPSALTKIDSSGNIQWVVNFSSGKPSSIIATGDNGYAYATISNSHFITLCKLDSNGESKWNKTLLDVVNGSPMLVQTKEGGYVIAVNNSTGTVHFGEGAWTETFTLILFKLDAFGATQWVKVYDVPGYCNQFCSLIQTADEGFALAGSSGISIGMLPITPSLNGTEFCLVKIGAQGNLQWSRTYGGVNDDDAIALIQTHDGGYVLAGNTDSFGNPSADYTTSASNALLVKTDSAGNIAWAQTYNGTINALIEAADGSLVYSGQTHYSYVHVACLAQTDCYGNLQWSQSCLNSSVVTGGYSDYAWSFNSLLQASDGSIVAAGYAKQSMYSSDGDCYLIKTKPIATVTSSNPHSTPTLEFPTVTIAPDGSVNPPNAPLTRNGDTYTLTADFHGVLNVQKSGVTLDGQNHWLIGNGSIGNLNVLLSQVAINASNVHDVAIHSFRVGNYKFAVWLNGSSGVSISENIFHHNGQGVLAAQSSNVTISSNDIAGGWEGIYCTNCQRIQITKNTLNNEDTCVTLKSCNDTAISRNQVTQCFGDQLLFGAFMTGVNGGGIYIEYSFNSIVAGNVFTNNWEAFALTTSSGIVATGNTFTKCNHAIGGGSGGDNLFYLNSFVNSTWPNSFYYDSPDIWGHSLPFNGTNRWDNDTMGNYWSNYTQRYPDAKQVGDTGTWDTPYVIDDDNIDYHPLVKPASLTEPDINPTPQPTTTAASTTTTQPTSNPTQKPTPAAPELSIAVLALAIAAVTSVAVLVQLKRKRETKH